MCLLVVMLRAERDGRTHVAEAESLERLADQFRQDVHAAVGETVVNGKEPHQWRLDLSGNRTVEYTIADNGISRASAALEARAAGVVSAAQQLQRGGRG